MSSNDPNRLRKNAAYTFIERLSPQDQAAVGAFETCSSPSSGFLALRVYQDFTSNKDLLKKGVDAATYEGCGTNLWDATFDSVQAVSGRQGASSLVLTDGEDNASQKSAQDVIDKAKQAGVSVYMVGLGNPSSLAFREMQRVAAETGGTFAYVEDAAGLQALFDQMFNAIRASFCVEVQFRVNGQVPPAGSQVQGTLVVNVNGRDLSLDFNVEY